MAFEPARPRRDGESQILTEFDRLKVDLTRYVALTIRTDYSDALRGKGFIYVSPDRGAQAFRGHNIIQNAWTAADDEHYRLKAVLKHEVGHVFGLTHASEDGSIMNARLPEQAVNLIDYHKYVYRTYSIFFPKAQTITSCDPEGSSPSDMRRVFSFPADHRCARFQWDLNTLSIYTGENTDSDFRTLNNRIRFPDGGQRRHQQQVTLWLPPEQKLINGLGFGHTVLLGPAKTEVQQQVSQVVVQSDGSQRLLSIMVQTTPRYFQLGGVLDGRLIPDLIPASGITYSGWSDD